jgi:hypothetical protein
MSTDPETRPEGENRLTPEFFLAELFRLSNMRDETTDAGRRKFYKNRIKILHARWKNQLAFDKREAKRCLKQQGS